MFKAVGRARLWRSRLLRAGLEDRVEIGDLPADTTAALVA